MVYGFLYTDQTHGLHTIQKEHEPLLVGYLDMEALVNYCSVVSLYYIHIDISHLLV